MKILKGEAKNFQVVNVHDNKPEVGVNGSANTQIFETEKPLWWKFRSVIKSIL